MRHGDINLTMSLYTHTLRGQESEVVKSLPNLSLPSKERQKASGTEDKVVKTDSSAYKKLTKKSYFNGLQTSLVGIKGGSKNLEGCEENTSHKSLDMITLDTRIAPISPDDICLESNAPGRTRTCNLRIRSPRS